MDFVKKRFLPGRTAAGLEPDISLWKIAYKPRKRTSPERCLMLSQSENGYERLVNGIDSLTRRSFLFLLSALGCAGRYDSAGPRRVDSNRDAHCHSRL